MTILEKLARSLRSGMLVALGAVLFAGAAAAQTSELRLEADQTQLLVGETVQLRLIEVVDGVPGADLAADPATSYTVQIPGVATVSGGGLLQAARAGTTLIFATNDELQDGTVQRPFIQVSVNTVEDRDGDGLPNDYETANGLDPDDPADAAGDLDLDGLSNLEEFQRGTDPQLADTDGDGLSDGQEVAQGSDPLDPASPAPPLPRLDESCVASILNQSTQVNPDGTFILPNVPAELGFFRLRVVCVQGDETVRGQTSFLQLEPNGTTDASGVVLGNFDPIPALLTITGAQTTLTRKNETSQLTATALYFGGGDPGGGTLLTAGVGKATANATAKATVPGGETTRDVTSQAQGTLWTSSNAAFASVSADGLVTAHRRGRVIIQARNEGVVASFDLEILIPNDADGDGLSDEFEIANGLNPNDASDAGQDRDGDGLTSLQEFQLGTSVNNADTDGDGIRDGDEISLGTNPLLADTDGDGLIDGDELFLGTDPNNPDTDGDGLADGLEVEFGLDPRSANPTTAVRGRVVDPQGAAVAGATAVISETFTGLTDATGQFLIPSVPADRGPISVFVRSIRAGQVSDGESAPTAPLAGGLTDVGQIQLDPVIGRVTGTVFSPRGATVRSARVTVTSGADFRSTNADVTGQYRADSLPSGPVTVEAVDPSTGLRGRATGTLATNGSVVIDVRLSASGTIFGPVLGRDGISSVGAGASASLFGPAARSGATGVGGSYRFGFVPLGVYRVEASDALGNRGRTAATVTRTSEVVRAPITYLGRGRVSGTVETASGFPVAGATVTLQSRSVFGGSFTATTGSVGEFSIDGVFVGNFTVSASDPGSGLGGFSSEAVERNGEVVPVTITLTPAGTLTGTVFAADGSTPVPGSVVTLTPSLRESVADGAGIYRFNNLPLGSYTLDVTNPANGDRARTTVSLGVVDEVVTTDLVLNGLGTVNVTVRDAGGQAVPGAQVLLTSRTLFGGVSEGITDAAGQLTFANVLAGPFNVSAMDPLELLGGSIESNVLVGENLDVTVSLEAAGNIAGRVLAADGTTPLPNIRVRLSPVGRELTTAVDGTFRFDMLPVARSPYTLQAFDSNGALRAEASGLSLGAHGAEINQDLVLSGIGTVTGVTLDPDGAPAAGVGVTLDSSVPGLGDLFATTDSFGVYTIAGVPEGAFTLLAVRTQDRLAGAGFGTVVGNGQVVVVDIQLVENLLPPTSGTLARLFDANNFEFAVQQDGAVRDGTTAVFRGDGTFNRGALLLSLDDGGTVAPFAGNGGFFELGGRQISIPPGTPSPSGLQVQRKVYVPQDGYFARYLEVLSNPTAGPVTVNLRLDSNFSFIQVTRDGFRFDEPPRIVATSSGDGNLVVGGATGDRWVILDDNADADPMRTNNLPTTVHVFDGSGATQNAGAASFAVDFANRFGRLQTQWQGLVVGPGETVIVMHFAVQEMGREAALAAATRLVQLPPEALAGLTVEERAAIVNFPVPADGSSPLAPLAPLDGSVSGTVFEGDGATLVPRASVRWRSDNAIFGRVFTVTGTSAGTYSLASRLNNSGSSIAVPRSGFTVEATHPQTRVVSSAVAGTFPGGGATAVRDVLFSGSGLITGTVRRPDGTVASAGTVRLTGDALLGTFTAVIEIDGAYRFTGLPPGTYSLVATTPTGVTGATSTTVVAGQQSLANITLVPTGTVAGLVRGGGGAVAVNIRVELTGSNLSRAVNTDTAGAYVFPDVPLGTYTVRAIEPATGLPSAASVDVFEDQTTNQDLDLIAVGTVEVEATYSDASLATQAAVQIRRDALGAFFTGIGSTDFLGRRIFAAVPAGSFTVRVFNPANNLAVGEATAAITVHGEVVTLAVVVPVDLPPTAALVAPTAGTVSVDGTAVDFVANAADDFGISRVEFLVDGAVVATDFIAPYAATVPVAAPAVGEERTLVAAAVDNGGQRTESAPVIVRVLRDLEPPTVTLTAPAAGASFIEGRQVSLLATASDNVAVAQVDFAANGTVFATDAFASYGATFSIPANYAGAGPTALELRATAVDRAGLTATSAVTVTVVPDQPPTITLTAAPPDGANVIEGSTVVFSATATDDVGVVVELLVDGVLRQTRSAAPFTFQLVVPQQDTVVNPIQVVLRARDTMNQITSAPAVALNVVADDPPTVTLTAPAAGVEIIEGSLFTLSADATDDLGVDRVEFRVDGQLVGTDTTAPYTAETRLASGTDLSSVNLLATAFDTAQQTGTSLVQVLRRDDTVPPTVAVDSPSDGSIFSVGPSDVAIVIDTSGSTSSSCGADVDGDGFFDNILKCEIFAAKELLNFLDPDDTQVTVIDFSTSAIIVRTLTSDFTLADQALNSILAAGPSGGTNFTAAMQQATNELAGVRVRRGATPIQLFFSDGSASFPTFEVTRAFEGGVIANTFAVGAGASPTILTQIANGTGGVFTPVIDPGDLVEILPRIIQFGIDALAVVTNATDNAGVREVEIRVRAVDGSIDETVTDIKAPFTALFSLPALVEPLDLEVTVIARDYGDNEATAGPIAVTALPAVNDPQIVRLAPTSGAPGNSVQILGKFFEPDRTLNTVTFNGLGATVSAGNKISLTVTVPAGATDGPVVVETGGLTSNSVPFRIDTDGDGLSDQEEIALGTDPANPDTDGDGLPDGEEVNVRGTDPLLADTDGDGLDDGVELVNGLNPLDGTDAAADPDGDGLSNAEEIALGTNRLNPDTDGDGLLDGEEVNVTGTDPFVVDTDGDGLTDGDEVNTYGTDPLAVDTDGDGIGDGVEVAAGLDPLDAADAGADPDGDGLTNAEELVTYGTDPQNPDSDFDSLDDGDEVVLHLTNPARSDTDGGGRNDGNEVLFDGTDPLLGADDLTLPNTGDLYVLDATSDTVLRLTPDRRVAVLVTRAQILAATGQTDVSFFDRGIAVSPRGEVFFSDAVADGVVKRRADGTLTLLASRSQILAVTGLTFADPKDLTVAGDGFLYLTEDASLSILRIDPDTGAVSLHTASADFLALPGIFSIDFNGGIAGASDGTVYQVSRLNPDAVFAIAPNGTPAVLASGSPFFDPGVYITLAPDGDLMVADDSSVLIHRVSVTTGAVSTFLSLAQIQAALGGSFPDLEGGIAFDAGGNFYLAEENTDNVLRFEASSLAGSIWVSEATMRGVTGVRPNLNGGIAFVPLIDRDGDGLSDQEELLLGTDPNNPDTDGDGIGDGDEVANGLDPLDPADGPLDPDGDGLTNAQEIALGTNPFAADTDGDGLDDGDEVNVYGTNPLAADTDGDGLTDTAEINVYGTDPLLADTDGDGLSDGVEVANGLDPLDGTDAGADPDGDGLTNAEEIAAGTDRNVADTDGDGLNDGEEVNVYGTDPLGPDTDGDGLTDGEEVNVYGTDPLDPDTDSDGLTDGEEVNVYGTDPLLADTDGDGFSDGTEVGAGTDPLDPTSVPTAVLYGVTQSGGGPSRLYRLDASTGAATLVGSVGFNRISAMDTDELGTLYATGVDPATGNHTLLTIDRLTGVGTAVGPTGVEFLGFGDTVADISFRPANGLFYAYLESGDGLGTIDPVTGVATAIGSTFTNGCCGNGMAFDTAETLFHATEFPLDTLDLTTGNATLVANLAFSSPADNFPRINGMDFLPGTTTLYASLNDGSGGSPENYLSTIDIVTGVVTIVGPTAGGMDALAWVVRADSDGDGLSDAEEGILGTDPNNPDSDTDGLTDGQEVLTYGTDPLLVDTDGGGRSDGDEVLVDGTDPLNPADDL